MSIKYNGKTIASNYKISASTTASDTKAGPIKIATEQELKDTTNNKVAVTPYLLNKALNGVNRGLKIGRIGIGFINESQQQERYLNGQVIIQDQFESFATWVKDLIKLYPNLSCTNEEFENACTLSAFGQCGKFVVDDNAGSIRLPKVVNVQGLFDLTQAGLTVEAGLPNITTTFTYGNDGTSQSVNGALTSLSEYTNSSTNTRGSGVYGFRAYKATFNASGSSSIYGNSTTVQQEAVQYPYWIQVATGVETSVDVTRELELNNPFFFGMSQYFEVEPNNISWLKSVGQWNSKAVYTDYYNWILTNVNNGVEGFIGNTMYMWGSASGGYMCQTLTPKVGSLVWGYSSKTKVGYVTKVYDTGELDITDNKNNVSYTKVDRYSQGDESSNVYITDYDFVLNTVDETFRLPLLDGSEILPSDRREVISFNASASYVVSKPVNGFYTLLCRIANQGNGVSIKNITTQQSMRSNASSSNIMCGTTMFVLANNEVSLWKDTLATTNPANECYFIPAQGNGSLYFYVGETVQNANLVNLGRVEETLASLIPDNSSLISGYGMPSSKYIDLSLGTSGTSYTAPANGYFNVAKLSSSSGQFLSIFGKNNLFAVQTTSTASNNKLGNFVPVFKGETITITYNAGGNVEIFRFIYAKGSESEAQ